METNYLQATLRPAGTPLETCTLCGTIVNRDYWEAHDRVHA